MIAATRTRARSGARPGVRLAAISGVVLAVVAAMAVDTKVVRIDAAADAQSGAFSPAAYGKSEFPKVQSAIDGRAVDVATLAAALAKDPVAATKQYGVAASAGPEFAVKFDGVAEKEDSGVYDVAVDGVPGSVLVRVQTGPAISGTDLRDATGTINFGQFTNQIEYQNAGSALNKEMKKQVLAKVDAAKLAGKRISVVGVFQWTTPESWLVTPVRLGIP